MVSKIFYCLIKDILDFLLSCYNILDFLLCCYGILDIDECASVNKSSYSCDNILGSFTLKCLPGYDMTDNMECIGIVLLHLNLQLRTNKISSTYLVQSNQVTSIVPLF